MKSNNIVKKAVAKKNKKSIEQLYLNYIKALVKSEHLHNSLEKACTMLNNTPNSSYLIKQRENLNNSLNNLLTKVMLMQNAINYINSCKK